MSATCEVGANFSSLGHKKDMAMPPTLPLSGDTVRTRVPPSISTTF